MPEARRRLFVKLPPEDQIPGQDDIGLLLRGMYGTQDAGQLWQEDYSLLLQSGSHKPGRASPATFYNADSGARTLVHGDDLVMLADDDAIASMDKLLSVPMKQTPRRWLCLTARFDTSMPPLILLQLLNLKPISDMPT